MGRRHRRLRLSSILGYGSLLALLVLVGYLIFPYYELNMGSPVNPVGKRGVLHAAIVDQLASVEPSSGFIPALTGMLTESGISYDIYLAGDVTVSFYTHLARYGYNLIILRVHTGIGKGFTKIGLFTGEAYDPNRYVLLQSEGLVAAAEVKDGSPIYFAVTPQFIREDMQGNFNGAMIVLGGCFGLQSSDLASAFVSKGARVVIGWNGLVDLSHTDRAVEQFLKNLILRHMDVAEAVQQTSQLVGPDPTYGSQLSYYPTDRGFVTLTVTASGVRVAGDASVSDAWKETRSLPLIRVYN